MYGVVLIAVIVAVVGLVFLLSQIISALCDMLGYGLEILGYLLDSALRVTVQGAVAILGALDGWFEDLDLIDEPLIRAAVMGLVGFLVGVGLLVLLAMILGQPWVIVTLALSVALGLGLGVLADPEHDWALRPFPTFVRRGGGGGPKLPLNL
jgi:hypothetical protein